MTSLPPHPLAGRALKPAQGPGPEPAPCLGGKDGSTALQRACESTGRAVVAAKGTAFSHLLSSAFVFLMMF